MSSTGFSRKRVALIALAACGVVGLVACGGGSGSSDDPATASLSLGGTAATGLAIAARPVDAKCVGGMGSATTNANGTYTVTVEGGASLPCVLRVTTADGGVLHSLATGSGSTARANITPISELILARLAGGDPAVFHDGFDGSAVQSLSDESVQAAVDAIVQVLASAGIDVSGIGDLLTADLVAATEQGDQGNAFDKVLDKLGEVLESTGTTLAQLTETIAHASPMSTRVPNAAPSLPAEMLLKQAAANCSSFRSGTYRMLTPMEEVPASRAITFDFDAATMTATFSDEGTTTFVADGDCKYQWTDNGGIVKAVVSAAGVGVLSTDFGNTSPYRMVLFFPEQKVPLADLAGTWNTLEWERNDSVSPFAALMSEFTVGTDGRFTHFKDCVGPDFTVCEEEVHATENGFVVNPAGGFGWVGEELSDLSPRIFAYRSGGGELMLTMVDSTGTLVVGTKQRVLTMSPAGTVSSFWSAAVHPDGLTTDGGAVGIPPVAGDFRAASWTITAIDTPAPGSFVRADALGAEQTLTINAPRDGLMRRAAGPAGSPLVMMNLHGMGVTASARITADPAQGFFMLSVGKQP